MKRAVKKHPISHIAFHPLIQILPRWADDSEDLLALAADIRERGIDQPLICSRTSGGKGESGVLYLLDGRHRFFGAQMGGLKSVPVIVRQEEEAQSIVLNSLAQRRHYTKGALAYLSYPVISGTVYKQPGRPKKELPTELAIISGGKISCEQAAAKLGFSRELFRQAGDLHERFAEHPELKQQFEPRLLSGEIGLGHCIAGIGGKIATDGKEIGQTVMTELLADAFKSVVIRVKRDWQKITHTDRLGLAKSTVELIVQKWPGELHESLYEALKEKLKGSKK